MTEKAKPKPKTPALTLAAKLLAIRKKVLYLKKDAEGGSGKFVYQYVAGVDVLGAIKPMMDEMGLLLVPSIVKARTTVVQGKKYNKWDKIEVPDTQYLVDMDMEMTWVDVESGEKLVVPFFAMANMDDAAKSVGSALTYTERYFLCKFFQVETDELDPDAYQRKKGQDAGASDVDLAAVRKAAVKDLSGATLAELMALVKGQKAAPALRNWAQKYRPLAGIALHPDHGTQLWAAVKGKMAEFEAAKAARSQEPPLGEECPTDGAFDDAPSGPRDEPDSGFPF